jgi:hypothetical protein
MGSKSKKLMGLTWFAYAASVTNILLAANFFPAVPFLGWLNHGHGVAPGWIPDVLEQTHLPEIAALHHRVARSGQAVCVSSWRSREVWAMSVLNRIAFYQGRRDEVPNQELARELAAAGDAEGIREIAGNLWSTDRNVQSDCLKVLYEIGYISPELIADYVGDFLKLLTNRNNRLVWGSMIALATISKIKARDIWACMDDVLLAVEEGSLITVVWGVKALAGVASVSHEYREMIFPILIKQLQSCIPRDVPMHAESILPAVDGGNRAEFLSALESRRSELTSSQAGRLRKVIRRAEAAQDDGGALASRP